jgi:hypothetical protein
MQPGEMNIDPIEAEFSSTEALDSLADAFILEAIQNSLDALQPGLTAKARIAFPSLERIQFPCFGTLNIHASGTAIAAQSADITNAFRYPPKAA